MNAYKIDEGVVPQRTITGTQKYTHLPELYGSEMRLCSGIAKLTCRSPRVGRGDEGVPAPAISAMELKLGPRELLALLFRALRRRLGSPMGVLPTGDAWSERLPLPLAGMQQHPGKPLGE